MATLVSSLEPAAQTPAHEAERLSLAEGILRPACGARDRDELLCCIAQELGTHVPVQAAWLAELVEDGRVAQVRACWPGSSLWLALPRNFPVKLDCIGRAMGGWAELAIATDEAWIVTAVAPEPGPVRLLGLSRAPAWDEAHMAFLCRHLAAVQAALELPAAIEAPHAQKQPPGVDRVEMAQYVARALAHEVRNLMSGIIGAAELARAQAGEMSPAVLTAVQRRAVEGIGMTEAMRRQLNKFAGKTTGPVNLAEVARLATQTMGPLVNAWGWEPAPRLECAALPAWTLADEREIGRALIALMFNAVRAAGPGGSVKIWGGVERNRAVVAVADDGPGMSDEVRRRAKEPFYTTEPAHHAGLGLTIAEEVARRFGGCVTLEPGVGGGLTAALRLPLWRPTAEQA